MPPRKAAAATEPTEGVRRSSRIKDLPKPVIPSKPRTKKGEAAKGKKRKAEEGEKDETADTEKPASKKAKPSSKASNKPASRAGSKKPSSKVKGNEEEKENAASAVEHPIAEDPEAEAAAEAEAGADAQKDGN